jgi:hypothetical protein
MLSISTRFLIASITVALAWPARATTPSSSAGALAGRLSVAVEQCGEGFESALAGLQHWRALNSEAYQIAYDAARHRAQASLAHDGRDQFCATMREEEHVKKLGC